MRRPLVVAVLPLLLGACTAGVDGSAGAQPSVAPPELSSSPTPAADGLQRFYEQPVAWSPCRGDFECGEVEVPLDYDDPDGATISLALLRAPATDPSARLGSLFVYPGGPGSSGLDYAAGTDVIVSPAVRRVYDVVGFDPRGVGESSPVDCVTDAELDDSYNDGDPTPDTPAEVDEAMAGVAEFRDGCIERSGDLLPHVGTTDVARDMDILRAAVGDQRLTYMGKSYGTSISLEYLRLFPENTGRLLLDGVVDPALTAEELLYGQAEGLEVALSRFVQECVADGCAIGATEQQVRASIGAVLATTDEAPLPTSSRPLTQALAFPAVFWPLYWPPEQGYPVLEESLRQALDGDGTALLAIADAYLGRNPDGTYQTNQWDIFTPVSCLDRPSEVSPADVQALLPTFDEASPLFGEALAWGLLSCSGWPVPSDGLPAPVRAPEAPPVLVLGTTGDPATPYDWAVSVADDLATGVLLTYDGTPHTAYRKGSACVDAAVDAYLLDGAVPADGTRCE
jgi:pimeloyl-ACP methyl ester carboxylesterase